MGKPNRTLLVLKYLWERTDDRASATIADIFAYLEERGVSLKDYRVIQRDIADLSDIGFDIIIERKQRYEYRIGKRLFDVAEIKLLVDAIQSSKFIGRKQSKATIRKLAAFLGPHDANIIKRQLYVDERHKANNESVMRTVDVLHDAIATKSKVMFQYFDFSPDKKRVARHDGASYVVSPYSMLWNNDNYYMVGFSEDRGMIQKFRIDRIENLSTVEESFIKPPKDYSVSGFFSKEFSMFSGKDVEVELLVENQLMNSIIDRFGEKVRTEIVDEQHFKVRTTVSLSGIFYGWVFASQGKIQLTKPKEALDEFYSIIDLYQKAR